CGPRYTLITRLPYDRPHTTMASFALCPECAQEYADPHNRRFHAEPLACPTCGPQLQFTSEERGVVNDTPAALAAAVTALHAGFIVAVKGIGGYHLMCDAGNATAVERLRRTKPRPHKPLAVMVPMRGSDDLAAVRDVATINSVHAAALLDPTRPIVLAPKRADSTLAAQIAPGLNEIGLFLPYSPLHHLLLADFGGPLVATSANISGEPVLTDATEVEARLAHVADACLHHNRPIARPADDSVLRVIAGKPRPIRHGRGTAPLEIELSVTVGEPTLAVGGHMKNTIALAWGNRLVISPHIGDLDAPRSLAVFEQVINDLQSLYSVTAQRIVHDAHPGYASTRFAKRCGLPQMAVFHHHAHASALAGEFPEVRRWLVFTWDGVGYGEDGTLWGGEALLGRPGQWQRVASFRPFHLPGGEKAGREPWRSAVALCWESGIEWDACPEDTRLLRQAWTKRINTPQSSAVGRLFDAAAALIGINLRSSFEGQGPMLLEALTPPSASRPVALPLSRDSTGLLRCDWQPLLPMLLNRTTPVPERAASFHASLAQALIDQAQAVREQEGDIVVGLTGGVFQNKRLAEQALELLARGGFDARLPQVLPANDAALSFGQIIESAGR
ncbi:MAG: carbamoyltransferase HypF, partial [Pseudomonadota bacterium]